MKKNQKLYKQEKALVAQLQSLTVVLKDQSYRRRGGYFYTKTPSFEGLLVWDRERRTQYLMTYYCVRGEHKYLVDQLAEIKMSISAENERLARIQERRQRKLEALKEYLIDQDGYVLLSERERHHRSYDAVKLARTLQIALEDAKLLGSEGKTYVYANVLASDEVICLYHPDLSSNPLKIHVQRSANRPTAEEHDAWYAAPYSKEVGITANLNHFVC